MTSDVARQPTPVAITLAHGVWVYAKIQKGDKRRIPYWRSRLDEVCALLALMLSITEGEAFREITASYERLSARAMQVLGDWGDTPIDLFEIRDLLEQIGWARRQ